MDACVTKPLLLLYLSRSRLITLSIFKPSMGMVSLAAIAAMSPNWRSILDGAWLDFLGRKLWGSGSVSGGTQGVVVVPSWC